MPVVSTLYQGIGFKTGGHVLSGRRAMSQSFSALVSLAGTAI